MGDVDRQFRVKDGFIAEHLRCCKCGYDLYGLEATHDCPECGTAAPYRVPRKRLACHWPLLGLLSALTALLANAGFRIILAQHGLHQMDLWAAGDPRRMRWPGAPQLVAPIGEIFGTTFWLAPFLLAYCLAMITIAAIRRDGRAMLLASAATVLWLIAGCDALGMLLIAGGV